MKAFHSFTVLMVYFAVCGTSQAGFINASLVGDIEVHDRNRDGDFGLVEEGSSDLDITNRPASPAGNGVRRGALEFDIRSLPSGMTIDSAVFSLHITHGLGNPQLEIHGYSGDGVLEANDVEFSNLLVLNSQPLQNTPKTTTYDLTAFVSSLYANGDSFAGIMLNNPVFDSGLSIHSSEVGGNTIPSLVIEYSQLSLSPVPEPSSLVMLTVSALSLLGVRTGHRRKISKDTLSRRAQAR